MGHGKYTLIERSGFPEPFLANNELEANRWRQQYVQSLLSTDVYEIQNITQVRAMKLVFELLRHKVGSPISYQSIAEDVAISPHTVKKYIEILESLYIIFRVTPFSKNIARSLLKEPKLYFFDTALVIGDEGAKTENFVAISLLKHVYASNDYLAKNLNLHYLRTKEGVEVDFAVVQDEKIKTIIEVKHQNKSISKALFKFHQKYQFDAIQLVRHLRTPVKENDIAVLKLSEYLQSLYL